MRADIVAADIDTLRMRASNAYDVVRILRPAMLQADRLPMPMASEGLQLVGPEIHVYVDDVLLGGVGALSAIPVQSIISIRRFSALEATTRYGIGHPAGVIAVTTGARGR